MKIPPFLTIILIFTAATAFFFAAPPTPINICVRVEAADTPRLFAAFGSILNLKDDAGNPRDATEAEIEHAVAQWMGQQTADYERRQNMQTFTPPPFVTGGTLSAAMGTPAPTPKPQLSPSSQLLKK